MGANEIKKKIQDLSITEKTDGIDKSIRLIKKHELQDQMQSAADVLYEDYSSYPGSHDPGYELSSASGL